MSEMDVTLNRTEAAEPAMNAVQEHFPSDLAARLEAIHPGKSFLIQAPAGSGKTELLTDRILALLATVNRPEEILAITFTRKAASEMHARVLKKLALGLQENEPGQAHQKNSWKLARAALQRDSEKGWNLLTHPARLSVKTIDSFCASLVRSMPWLSGMGGIPAITEEAGSLYGQAARRVLALIDAEECVQALVLHLDVDLQAAEDLLVNMLGFRDQWLHVVGDPASALMKVLESLAQAMDEDIAKTSELMPMGWAAELAPIIRVAASHLDSVNSNEPHPLLDWDGTPLEPVFTQIHEWKALAVALLTAKGTLRSRLTVKEGFPAKSAHKEAMQKWLDAQRLNADEWATALHELTLLPDELMSPQQIAIIGNLLQCLQLAAQQLEHVFASEGSVDFIEIAWRAGQALGTADDPAELLLSLDAAIRHILIDEFQDTSQVQIDLIEKLTSGWLPEDGRTLFLVGDPMQSIYRFRKAEVGLFLQVAQQGINDLPLEVLHLKENFRSRAGVVECVNDTFAQVFPVRNDPVLGAIEYTPSVPFNACGMTPAVLLHPFYYGDSVPASLLSQNSVWPGLDTHKGNDKEEGRQPYLAIAKQDATAAAENRVVELVKAALQKHAGKAHPVAILVRARTHLNKLMHRLVQEGIPVRAVDLQPLKDRQVVIDMVQLVQALSHPADRLAWLSFLRSPLCGLTLASLDTLFGTRHQIPVPLMLAQLLAENHESGTEAQDEDISIANIAQSLPETELQRVRAVAGLLLQRPFETGEITFSAYVESVWRALGGFVFYHRESEYDDVQMVLRLLDKIAPYGGLNPARLESELERLYAASSHAEHAVEIMTMHKSKGLEFEEVILYGLHRIPRNNTEPLLRFEQSEGRLLLGPIKPKISQDKDPVSAYLGNRENKRSAYELDRLLYVAATRACQRLHLFAELQVKEGGVANVPASTLFSRLQPLMASFSTVLPVYQSAMAVQAEAGQAYYEVNGSPLLRLSASVMQSLHRTQNKSGNASGGFANPGEAWHFEEHYEAQMGTVVHAWLARMGQDQLLGWTPERIRASNKVIIRQLLQEGLRPEQAAEAVGRVQDLLLNCLSSEKGQWLLTHGHARQEWELTDTFGKVLIVDVAVSGPEGWLVVDYKTARKHENEPQAVFENRLKKTYAAQLQAYCRRLTALDGRPARAVLYALDSNAWIEI